MVKLHKKEDNVYESYSSCLEAQADFDRLKDFLGDEYFNKWFSIKDKLSGKDAKYKAIYDILKFDEDEVEELKDFLDNFQSKTSKIKQDKEKGSTKVAEDENYIVLRITDYKAAQKYGSHTTWCITGRYHGHEERGEYYFNKYIEDEDLDGGYYFYLSKHDSSEKYCLLVHRDHDSIESLWDAEDEKMAYIPRDILEVSEGLPFYDAMKAWSEDVWSALDRAETFHDFLEAVDYSYDICEMSDEGVPLGFKLLEYWEYHVLDDLEESDREDFKEFVNMETDDGDNILEYVKPSYKKTVEFIFSNGFTGSVDNWLGSLRKDDGSKFADVIKEYVDFSKVDKDALGHFLSLLGKEQALEYVDYMANKDIIQLAINTDEWDVLDHLHKPLTKDDAERILGTIPVVANRPDLVIQVIDNNITNIDNINGHHYIFWLLFGYAGAGSSNSNEDKRAFEKVIKYILQHKKVDTNAIIKDIEENGYFSKRDEEIALSFFKTLLPKETEESMFYSSLEEAKQKDAGVIVKVGDYWRIKGNIVKYWPAKFKTRDDALAALRAYHAQRNG